MTLFNLLEEIKIIKRPFPDSFDDPNELKKEYYKNKDKTLKSISNKVNEKLKEIYHPEFLKKIYKSLQHVYINIILNNKEPGLSAAAYTLDYAINKLAAKIFIKKKLIKKTPDFSAGIYKSRKIKITQFGVMNKDGFISLMVHEIQHLLESDSYNLMEFGNLKRKLIVLLSKYKKLKPIYDNHNFIIKNVKTNVAEILSTINNIEFTTTPFWGKLKKITKHYNQEFTEKLYKILKESKIYNEKHIRKVIEFLNDSVSKIIT